MNTPRRLSLAVFPYLLVGRVLCLVSRKDPLLHLCALVVVVAVCLMITQPPHQAVGEGLNRQVGCLLIVLNSTLCLHPDRVLPYSIQKTPLDQNTLVVAPAAAVVEAVVGLLLEHTAPTATLLTSRRYQLSRKPAHMALKNLHRPNPSRSVAHHSSKTPYLAETSRPATHLTPAILQAEVEI